MAKLRLRGQRDEKYKSRVMRSEEINEDHELREYQRGQESHIEAQKGRRSGSHHRAKVPGRGGA